jgi:hypothetical protein
VLWYGITLIVIGLIAMASSWRVEDVDRIWCRHPPRGWRSQPPDALAGG